MDYRSNELYHHGIKGMKWGVRRKRNKYGKRSSWSRDASLKKKNVNALSNDELKRVNERSKLETEYKRLNPSTVQKGLKFVGSAGKKALSISVSAIKASAPKVKKGAAVAMKLLKKLHDARVKKKSISDDAAAVKALEKKKPDQLTNAELKKLNERRQLEQQYRNLNPSAMKKGMKFVSGAAAVTGTAMALYNNSNAIVKIGKKVAGRIIR